MVIMLEDVFNRFFYSWPNAEPKPPASVRPVMDEDESHYIGVEIQFALAGFQEQDLKVYHEGRTLIVEGKNVHRDEVADKFKCSFSRKFSLQENLDIESADVRLENGILAVFLPVRNPDENRTYLLGDKD